MLKMNVEKAIWSAYIDNPCRLFSIRELSLHLKKSYPLIHQHVSRLIQENKLLSQKVGKSILCYPNYNNYYSLLSLALAEENNTSESKLSQQKISLFQNFFSSEIFSGLLSVFIANNELVIVVASDLYTKNINESLSQTTFSDKIHFISLDSVQSNVNLLLNKSVVLFGYEQFHLLIRSNYDLYASKYNLVKLHE